MEFETGVAQTDPRTGKPARDLLFWPLDEEEAEEVTTAIDERGNDVTKAFRVITPRDEADGDTGIRAIQFRRFQGGWLVVRRGEKIYKVWRVNVHEDGAVTHYEAKTKGATDSNAGTIGLPKELYAEMEAAGL